MLDKKGRAVPWEEYIRNMALRFDKNRAIDPMAMLKKLVQTSSVENCQREFESIRFQAKCSEAHALSLFLGGLKDKLHSLVSLHKPTTVMEAFDYATLYESALEADYSTGENQFTMRSYTAGPKYNNSSHLNHTKPVPLHKTAYERPPPLPNHPAQARNNARNTTDKPKTIKRISNVEYAEKRKKNMCFYCDAPYVQGHDCELRRLNNIEIRIGDDEEEVFVEASDEELLNCEEPAGVDLYAVNGMPVFNTPKILGEIEGRKVVTLLDSGSSHNVIRS